MYVYSAGGYGGAIDLTKYKPGETYRKWVTCVAATMNHSCCVLLLLYSLPVNIYTIVVHSQDWTRSIHYNDIVTSMACRYADDVSDDDHHVREQNTIRGISDLKEIVPGAANFDCDQQEERRKKREDQKLESPVSPEDTALFDAFDQDDSGTLLGILCTSTSVTVNMMALFISNTCT